MSISRKSQKVTLQDIARRAGLSVSAVSLALRGHTAISEETRQGVVRIGRELGYKAKGLPVDGHRAPVDIAYCLVGESLQDEAYTPLAHGIIKSCRAWQAHLAIEQLPLGVPKAPVLMPTGAAPAGYVLAGFLDDAIIDFFTAGGTPVVIAGINQLSRPVTSVRPDLREASRMLAEKALADGCHHFVHVTANLTATHNRQFLEVVRSTLQEHGHSLPDHQVLVATDHEMHQTEFMDKLAGLFSKPTAILTAGERTATTCATILHTKGLMERFGLGIYSLRASDAGKISSLFYSLNIGIEEVGQVAVDRVIQKIFGYESCRDATLTLIPPRGWLSSTPDGEAAGQDSTAAGDEARSLRPVALS